MNVWVQLKHKASFSMGMAHPHASGH